MITLRQLLNKISDRKFIKGYIKYLKSLDFEEFNSIYLHYSRIFTILYFRYQQKNAKFLSKIWFKMYILKLKFKLIFYIFNVANADYIKKSSNLLEENNNKSLKILIEIYEVQNAILNIQKKPLVLTQNPNREDIIHAMVYFCSSIYNNQRLEELIQEFNKTKKF